MEETKMANQRLPGFVFAYRDGGLTQAVTTPSTEKLLIIGNALDGPVNTPITVQSLSDAEAYFGPIVYSGDYVDPLTGTADGNYADNTLVKAAYEAIVGGAGNLSLVRVGGNTASVTGVFGGSVNIYAKYPGRVYNSVVVTATSGSTGYTFTAIQPPSKNGTVSWTFPLSTLVGQAISTINNDTRNATIGITVPVTMFQSPITVLGVGSAALSGFTSGTNGTSAPGEDFSGNEIGYYNLLTAQYGTFNTLMNATFDIAVLTGIYGDDVVSATNPTTTSVANDFANWLYQVSIEQQPVHGVIGLRPTGLSAPPALTNYATNDLLNPSPGYYSQVANWINFGYFMSQGFYGVDPDSGAQVDIGRYLSVVAGPDIIYSESQLGYYLENGAAAYAGMITALPAQQATTNQALGGVNKLNGNYPKSINEQLNQGLGYQQQPFIAGSSAYVTFRYSNFLGAPIVVADNTCAQRSSDYKTLQVLRICNLASFMVQSVVRPFIGQPNEVDSRTAMQTQINTALGTLVTAGALIGGDGNGYQFTLSSDPVELLMGQVTITLFLRPALQIKYIRVVVNVTS
jgi:hypothetical protein